MIRCSPARGYRLPASALINLSHGNRSETGNQKLTAIVKPQPAVNHYNSYPSDQSSQLNGRQPYSLRAESQGNSSSPQKGEFSGGHQKHKAQSKQDDEFCNIWQSLQGSAKSQHAQQNIHEKSVVLPQETKQGSGIQFYKPDFDESSLKGQQRKQEPFKKLKEESKVPRNEGQSHKILNKQNFAGANKNIRLLKRNESANVSAVQKAVVDGISGKNGNELENLLASLKISKETEVQSFCSKEERATNEEHLSPQSFAMKGTQMLKEILKIDGSDSAEAKNEIKPLINAGSTSSGRQDSHVPALQHKQTKKMAAYINKTPSPGGLQNAHVLEAGGHPLLGPQSGLSTPVSELSRICSLVGMPQPDFSFLRTPQAMTVCQVKLSNGLLVHGPQCHSENEAKEKAAFFALQQLSSVGMNFPLPPPPPIFPSYQPIGTSVPPGSIPPVYTQTTANIMPPPPSHMFGQVPWGAPVPVHGKPYYPGPYPGNMPLAGIIPVGSHNKFIPLQVTKKRAASKKNFEFKEFPASPQAVPLTNEQPASSDATKLIPQDSSTSLKCHPAAQSTVPFQDKGASGSSNVPHNKSKPNASSKRKQRKLAVNFGAPKPSE
uniref:Uncharacterized protein n=1 Tax=Sphenodon punctatus TaxID=8508 RepID=A0A8D0GUT3_SPHPU